jgi:hypothetical protein
MRDLSAFFTRHLFNSRSAIGFGALIAPTKALTFRQQIGAMHLKGESFWQRTAD